MWKLGIKNSYTMEATFGGSTLGEFRLSERAVCMCVCVGLHVSRMRIYYVSECQATGEEHILLLET